MVYAAINHCCRGTRTLVEADRLFPRWLQSDGAAVAWIVRRVRFAHPGPAVGTAVSGFTKPFQEIKHLTKPSMVIVMLVTLIECGQDV